MTCLAGPTLSHTESIIPNLWACPYRVRVWFCSETPQKCWKFLNSFVYLPDSILHPKPQQKDFYSKFWYFLNLKSFVFFCKQSFAFVCLVFIISAYNSFKRRIKSICSCIIPLWAGWLNGPRVWAGAQCAEVDQTTAWPGPVFVVATRGVRSL